MPKTMLQRPRSRPISPPPVVSAADSRARSATVDAKKPAATAITSIACARHALVRLTSTSAGTSSSRSGEMPPRNTSGARNAV